MRILASRPLATACITAMATAVLMFFLPWQAKLIIAVILTVMLLTGAGFLLYRRNNSNCKELRFPLMLTLFLCLTLMLMMSIGSVWYFDMQGQELSEYENTGEPQRIRCVIREENAAGTGYSYYTVKVTNINERQVNVRASMECSYTAAFHVGDVIEAAVLVQSLEEYCDRDNLWYAMADGICVGLICENPSEAIMIGYEGQPVTESFRRWRADLSVRLLDMTGKRNGGLATALFLGDSDLLDDAITTAFRRAGVAHLLALSGMHVTLLLGMLTSIAYCIRISRNGRILLLVIFAVAYLALTGFRVSAVRAVGMVLIMYLSSLLGTQHDTVTTLSVVGFLMLIFSPSTVVDGGFWMSFCAVFGLVTVLPYFNKWLKNKHVRNSLRGVLQAIAASVIAVVGVSFPSWIFVGEIAPIGIVLTVLLTPLLTLILALIPLTLLADILPFLSAFIFSVPLRALLECMTAITDRFARMRDVSFSLQLPFAGITLFVMLSAVFLMLIIPLRRKIYLLIPPVIAVMIFSIGTPVWKHTMYRDYLQASYIVGSNGSMLVVTDKEGTAIIDTSAGNFTIMRDAEKAVADHGSTESEHLILTHYHRAFVYSTERLAKRQMIRCVYLPIPQTEEEYAVLSAMRDRLEPLGTVLRCYHENERLKLFGGMEFSCANVSYLERSSQPIITYILETSEEKLICSTPSVQESDRYTTFRCELEEADVLLLNKHGPTVKTPLELPWDRMSPRLLLIDSASMLPYIDCSSDSRLIELDCYTDIECFRFRVAK